MSSTGNRIIVIGAGAAGLMAAVHAAAAGAQVLLLDRMADGGRKILISGGGRCNVLPATLDISRFVTASSRHSLRRILSGWPHAEMRRFFEQDAALPLRVEPATGKLFPVADRSRAVRDALRHLATQRGVTFRGGVLVSTIQPVADGWEVLTAAGDSYTARRVVVATGGLSVPATGSDGFAFRALAALGHTVRPTYPALTPLTLDPPRFADLAGLSLPVEITAQLGRDRRQARGGFLFTHRGYSGPALLDVSDVAVRGRLTRAGHAELRVRWGELSDQVWQQVLAPAAGQVGPALRHQLPTRLADRLLTEAAVEAGTPLAQLDRAARQRLMRALTAFPLPWTSDQGYHKAEVTGGGIALEEVQPATLESRIHPGLHLAGELLDAFGPIGGYNFTWAWITGRLAGRAAAAP